MKRLLFAVLFTLCATGISRQHEPYTVPGDVDLVLLKLSVAIDTPASARMSVRTRPGYFAALKQSKPSR